MARLECPGMSKKWGVESRARQILVDPNDLSERIVLSIELNRLALEIKRGYERCIYR